MPSWSSYSYLFGPLVTLVFLGVIVLVLRWAFKPGGSLVASPPKPGEESEYGALAVAARPASLIEAEVMRQQLLAAGIKATVANTLNGPRVLVWPQDVAQATQVLSRPN